MQNRLEKEIQQGLDETKYQFWSAEWDQPLAPTDFPNCQDENTRRALCLFERCLSGGPFVRAVTLHWSRHHCDVIQRILDLVRHATDVERELKVQRPMKVTNHVVGAVFNDSAEYFELMEENLLSVILRRFNKEIESSKENEIKKDGNVYAILCVIKEKTGIDYHELKKNNSEISINYNESNKIGVSSAGDTYRGFLSGLPVSIKVIRRLSKNSFIENVKNEIAILYQLKCENAPNIVEYRIGGKSTGNNAFYTFYVITEHCELGSLRRYMTKNQPERNVGSILNIVYDCAVAINYLHSKEILHNNLNIDNVLMIETGEKLSAKLANFGYVSTVKDATMRRLDLGSDLNSLCWFAPELLKGSPCSTKTEMYSFSVLANQIVWWNDKGPYLQKAYVDVINQNTIILPDCPDSLINVIESGWQDDPSKRMSADQIVGLLSEELKVKRPQLRLQSRKKLDEGVYGVVFSCPFGANLVAVKSMEWHLSDLEYMSHVVSEIGLSKQLTQHKVPNVVAYMGCEIKLSCDHYSVYSIMELCELGSLYDYINKHIADRDVKTCLRIAYDCAAALDYFHSKKLLHNDLKSMNVLLRISDNQLTAKLGDFGFSCSVQYARDHNTNYHSIAYGAPELAVGGHNTTETDLYSFAVLMYETIHWNGKVPFANTYRNEQELKTFLSQLYLEQKNLALPLPADCPPELREVIERGWKIVPRERMPVSQIKATLFAALNPASKTASAATSTPERSFGKSY